MIIGIDIDDTITKTTEYTKHIFDKINTDPSKHSYHDLDIDDYCDFLNKYVLNIHKNVELFPNASEVIKEFKKRGWKVIFITARAKIDERITFGEQDKIVTKKYLKDHEIEYDEIVFSQKSKANACVNKNVDIYIDNREDLLDEVNEAGIKTIWLTTKKVDNSKHIIAKNWLEVKNIICGVD